MASKDESTAQPIKRGFRSRKPRMRVMMPCKIFHFRIPEPEEYQHMDEDDVSADVSESECDGYTPSLDVSSSTHHRDRDHDDGHESHQVYGQEQQLSPPESASCVGCKLCLERARETVVIFSCGHLYCGDCMFMRSSECPVCNPSITPVTQTRSSRALKFWVQCTHQDQRGGFVHEDLVNVELPTLSDFFVFSFQLCQSHLFCFAHTDVQN